MSAGVWPRQTRWPGLLHMHLGLSISKYHVSGDWLVFPTGIKDEMRDYLVFIQAKAGIDLGFCFCRLVSTPVLTLPTPSLVAQTRGREGGETTARVVRAIRDTRYAIRDKPLAFTRHHIASDQLRAVCLAVRQPQSSIAALQPQSSTARLSPPGSAALRSATPSPPLPSAVPPSSGKTPYSASFGSFFPASQGSRMVAASDASGVAIDERQEDRVT